MVKGMFIIIELFLLFLFIIPIFSGILNPGNIFGIITVAILLSITISFQQFKNFCVECFSNNIGKIIFSIIVLITAFGVIYCTVLSCFMINAQLNTPKNVKAVVVLGCKVNGDKPSRMLTRRLNSAYEYLIEHEEVICVVSGGQGSDEKISEALAMKNYLTNKGISEKRIIMEDTSTNTYENMKFSAEKLSLYNITEIAIVTDGFHQYRAGYIAKKYGFSVSSINAKNDFITCPLIPTYWVREWMAITKEYLFAELV